MISANFTEMPHYVNIQLGFLLEALECGKAEALEIHKLPESVQINGRNDKIVQV